MTARCGDSPKLRVTSEGCETMTGVAHAGMVTVAVELSVDPQALVARTQKFVVAVGGVVVTSSEAKLKYSSEARIAAIASSSAAPSSAVVSAAAGLRRRNCTYQPCTRRVRASVELRIESATLVRDELPSSARNDVISAEDGARPSTSL